MRAPRERRKLRSSRMHEALKLQLEAAAASSGALALVLADHQGLLIAQSDAALPMAEEVAALSPQLASLRSWAGLVPCEGGTLPVMITPLDLDRHRAYLAAVGIRSRKVLPVLQRTSDSVRRILDAGPP